jgi:hypothetical protein
LLVGIATIGISFCLQAHYSEVKAVDYAVRATNAAFALIALFVPDYTIASAACVPVLIIIGYWLVYRPKLEARVPEIVEIDAKMLAPAAAGTGALGTMS